MSDPLQALVEHESALVPAAKAEAPDLVDVAFPELPEVEPIEDDAKAEAARKMTAGRIQKQRLRAKLLFALRAQNYSHGQIAELTGLSVNAVKKALRRARDAGIFESATRILQTESTELAIESLNHHLRRHDKEMTKAHLKGMGFYKNYSNQKNETPAGFQMPPFQVNITFEGGARPAPEAIDVSDGAIGVPRTDD